MRLAVAVQLVQVFADVAGCQPFELTWNQTFDTCTLSRAVPMTVNTELLQRWPGVGAVMVLVGTRISVKFATKLRSLETENE